MRCREEAGSYNSFGYHVSFLVVKIKPPVVDRCSWGLDIQALKESFEVFCNKGVAGSTSAELLATFGDNLLKKGGSEKLSDEAIKDTVEKVGDDLKVLSLRVKHDALLWLMGLTNLFLIGTCLIKD